MTSLKGRLLGIDHGLARIGVAVSDRVGLTARELLVIHRKSKREDFDKLAKVTKEQQVIGIIVGLPSEYDDPEGVYTQASKVRNWVEYLRQAIPLPVVLWDEQLTSVDAQEWAKRLKRPLRAPIDDLAARIMLQSYLDAVRDGLMIFLPEFLSE
ncbi:MAG: Holliday junction resolvase RuvX [Anaerolineae bacterium]|nr:Holliday junction resolvase RuvX [Anaerolineae bacterium]NUQ02396.1 Holliday junction resolvase RuvX [Anaerolineae bacterium]